MNDTIDNMESILRRVQKLLAIAEDSRANPNEAAAAAQQAEKIMRKYQIDNADAMRKEATNTEAFGTFDCGVKMRPDAKNHKAKRIPVWGSWLAYRIAKLNSCEIRFCWAASGLVVRFFGFKVDAQVAAWTFDYLVAQVISGLRAYQREAYRSKAKSEAYRRGLTLAVCSMLRAELQKKEVELQRGASSRALVLVKEHAIAEKYGAFEYGDGKVTLNAESSAYMQGREAGSKVSLRQGISSATNDARRIA